MKTRIPVVHLNGSHETMEDVRLSPSCPCCGVSLLPVNLFSVCIDRDDEEDNIIYILNYCNNCSECFISKHLYDEEIGAGYFFDSNAPMKASACNFSDSISELSPDFVSIYRQASTADSLGLNLICGIGYRKSLEFLIKDYAIRKNPSSREEILSSPLMSCIKKYIKEEQLISLACASTWLGNDETHYIRKHPDYGIKQLKIFINAFVTFIDAELACEEAKRLLDR